MNKFLGLNDAMPLIVVGIFIKLAMALAIVDGTKVLVHHMEKEAIKAAATQPEPYVGTPIHTTISYIYATPTERIDVYMLPEGSEVTKAVQEYKRYNEPQCGRRFARDACDCLP